MKNKELIDKMYGILEKEVPKSLGNIVDVDMVKELGDGSNVTQEFSETVSSFLEDMFNALLIAMLKGITFTDKSKIEQRFGRSLEENYPNASKEFMDMAYSYWTYKIAVQDIPVDDVNLTSSLTLAKVEFNMASLFFPTQGPASASVKEREKVQREILEEVINSYGIKYDIEKYISGNPYLVKRKKFGLF